MLFLVLIHGHLQYYRDWIILVLDRVGWLVGTTGTGPRVATTGMMSKAEGDKKFAPLRRGDRLVRTRDSTTPGSTVQLVMGRSHHGSATETGVVGHRDDVKSTFKGPFKGL